jgi:hypothetical protein
MFFWKLIFSGSIVKLEEIQETQTNA